jgi:Na+/melibiose symporter-like transporter
LEIPTFHSSKLSLQYCNEPTPISYRLKTIVQSAPVLDMIRLLVSPFGATILSGTIIIAWLFPLSREKHMRIQKLLEQKRGRLTD